MVAWITFSSAPVIWKFSWIIWASRLQALANKAWFSWFWFIARRSYQIVGGYMTCSDCRRNFSIRYRQRTVKYRTKHREKRKSRPNWQVLSPGNKGLRVSWYHVRLATTSVGVGAQIIQSCFHRKASSCQQVLDMVISWDTSCNFPGTQDMVAESVTADYTILRKDLVPSSGKAKKSELTERNQNELRLLHLQFWMFQNTIIENCMQ